MGTSVRTTLILRYGIYSSLVLMICWMLEYLAGFHSRILAYDLYTEALSSVFFFVIIFLGIRRTRSEDSTYGKSLQIGLLITCCATILFTLFMVIYLKTINPEFGDHQIAYERDRLVQEGIPDDILIQKVNALRLAYGTGALLVRTIFRTLLEGSTGSLIASAFFKPKRTSGKQRTPWPA